MKSAMSLILRERQHQTLELGYDSAHDDQHTSFQLSKAAECYRHAAEAIIAGETPGEGCARDWPWSQTFKPRPCPIDNLVVAGALFMAEKMRIRRKGDKPLSDSYDASIQHCVDSIDKLLADRPIDYSEAHLKKVNEMFHAAKEIIDKDRAVRVSVSDSGYKHIQILGRDLNGRAFELEFGLSPEAFEALGRAMHRIALYELEKKPRK